MKVAITGASGFLGQKLTQALVSHNLLRDRHGRMAPISELSLFDNQPGQGPAAAPFPVRWTIGDLTQSDALEKALGEADTIFHLAAVVSAAAEKDFDLGYRVNVDGTRQLLEVCRKQRRPPRIVFCSSVAAFGHQLALPVEDRQAALPISSYGTQKVIGELLVADYSRKGFVDGRALRLPTIVVRPGKPNAAASSFASSILREPLQGESCICPVPRDQPLWVLSPRSAVACLLHACGLESERLDRGPVINLPGLTVTVAEMLDALATLGGRDMMDRVKFIPDPEIQAIVGSWPASFNPAYARQLGFPEDDDFIGVLQAFIEDDLRPVAA